MLKKKKNNKGFTLVELLVVIAIIGILAVVAIPSLMSNMEKAKVSKLEADYNVISTGVVTYYADKNEYPGNGAEIVLVADGNKTVTNNVMSGYITELSNPFKATYKLKYTGATNAVDSTPELSEIVIEGAKIKESGIAKLKNDLGSNKVKEDNGKISIALVGEYK